MFCINTKMSGADWRVNGSLTLDLRTACNTVSFNIWGSFSEALFWETIAKNHLVSIQPDQPPTAQSQI